MSHFLDAAPLALIAYVIFFGDLITGNEITKEAIEQRLDDAQEFNTDRSHLSISVRNFLSGLFVPFFSYQGILATGPHIVIVHRWRKGIKEMKSIYDGIGSYVSFGFPWFYFVIPLMTVLVAFQGIIFAQFMTLTAIGCAQVAMSLVRNASERGASLFMAVVLVSFPLEPGKALLIGTSVVFFSALILAFYTFVFMKFVGSDILTSIKSEAVEVTLQQNLESEEEEKSLNLIDKIFTLKWWIICFTLAHTLIGFVYSLIISIFVKKEDSNLIA